MIYENKIIQNQYQNTEYQRNWSISSFNELPLIQRIIIIHQVNKIIRAFRNYLSKKSVRKNFKFFIFR